MGAHHWGSDGPLYEYKGQTRRAGDYIEFVTRIQRDYYTRREQEVRGLGFKGVTVTTAWRTTLISVWRARGTFIAYWA